MGGDGGSIPTRDDLVKTKRSKGKLDAIELNRQLFMYCFLSRDPLVAPIVSCSLGKLYNKTAIISYLLAPTTAFGPEGHILASHIKSLKDVTTLHLTPNPTRASLSIEELASSSHIGTQEARTTSLFVCPISLREMNGAVPFVFRKPTGSVISLASLKEMRKSDPDTSVDPVTGLKDKVGLVSESWVTVNPGVEETEKMRVEMEARKLEEKEAKRLSKDKKRKVAKDTSSSTPSDSPPSVTDLMPPPAKKSKSTLIGNDDVTPATTTTTGTPTLSKSTSRKAISLSDSIAAKVTAEKKNQSAAVLSLYAPKNQDPNKNRDGSSNWMTRSCYTRYA